MCQVFFTIIFIEGKSIWIVLELFLIYNTLYVWFKTFRYKVMFAVTKRGRLKTAMLGADRKAEPNG
jgi:hypothetical protein